MRRTHPLAPAVVVAVAAATCAAPALAGARPASGPPVVAPRAGATVAGGTVAVRVRAGDRRGDLAVRLNGRPVGAAFAHSRGGRRTARLSLSHGLRRGVNVLRVRVRMADRRFRGQTVRFTLRARGVLVGAGPDQLATAGARVRVTGAVEAGADGARPRWTLVERPRNSRLRATALRPPAGAPATGFTPDVPGRYRLRLGAGAVSDDVVVAALPPSPFVPVEALATQDRQPGIRVGDTFYASSGGRWLQVLVLDRATLGLVSNRTYDCINDVQQADCSEAVARDLKKLDDTKLVIGAYPALGYWRKNMAVADALAPIGVADQPRPILPASAIGVPGSTAGEAFQSFKTRPDDPAGNLTGALVLDQFGNYRFIAPDHLQLDTRAPGSSAARNVVKVGGQTYTAALPAGAPGGFQVLVLDRGKVGSGAPPLVNAAFATTPVAGDGRDQAVTGMLAALRSAAGADTLVVVASIGPGGLGPSDANARSAAQQLGPAIAALGGTAHVLFNAADQGSPYALLGSGLGSEASGTESSTAVNAARSAGRITADLTRDHRMRFAPRLADPIGELPSDVADVAFAQPTPWPVPATDGQRAAIAFVQAQVGIGDLRTAYWQKDFTDARWGQIQGQVRALPATAGTGYTADDLQAVRDELVKEIGWLINVHSYLASLSKPFSSTFLRSWADLQAIADQVNQGVKSNAALKAQAELNQEIFGELVGLAAGPLETPGEIVATAYSITLAIASSDADGGGAEAFQTSVAKLGLETVTRLEGAQHAFDQLGDVIAADYGKLKQASSWDTDKIAGTRAAAGLQIALRRFLYSELMPLRFGAYELPVSATETDARRFSCTRKVVDDFTVEYHPFRDATPTGQTVTRFNPPTFGAQNRVFALGNFTGQFPEVPTAALTTPLFQPLDPAGDPTKGGLGLFPTHFVLQNWKPAAYTDSGNPCGWHGQNP